MDATDEKTIPANHGKVFAVNIEDEFAFSDVQESIMKISGIKDVLFDDGVVPHEIIVHTDGAVPTDNVLAAVKQHGFTATPEDAFPLY
jgi:hypothetical protein